MSGTTRALDFSATIAERTAHFSGRQWVFEAIDRWLADPAGGRVFVLTGGPGTGKTAIAARLAQANRAAVALPGCPQLRPGFLVYEHFCIAGRDSTLSPTAFVRALSESLANTCPAFRQALEQMASPQITMSPSVHTGPVATGSTVAGLIVNSVEITIHGDDARSTFDLAVRLPLFVQAHEHPDQTLVVLIDSLDEGLTFSPERSITHLLPLVSDFPPQVRFIVTSRSNNQRVFDLVGPPTLDLITNAPAGIDEVRTYASSRLAGLPKDRRTALAGHVATKSQGNFLYAYHVLNQLLAPGASPADAAGADLPDALEGVYRAFLTRELASSGERWSERYRPLLGAIVVARGDALTKAHVAGITGLMPSAIDDVLRACREYLVGGDSWEQPLRLYHHSFREFLLTDSTYHVYPAERHEAVARYFLSLHGKSWRKCEDDYALQHTPVHLAEAARGAEHTRDTLIRTLVELTTNPHFQTQCNARLGDLSVLREHLGHAITAVTLSERDEMLPWIARAGQATVSFHQRFLTGASVIALAKGGELATADARLALFGGLDRDWQVAARLILAWLASEREPARAQQLVDSIAAVAVAEPLSRLVTRIRASDASAFPIDEEQAERPDVGRALVRRLSGQAFDAELLVARGMSVSTNLSEQAELVADGGYAATMDGPVLVNSARVYGDEATANVDAYIDAHAGYNYVEYRNSSLWVVLQAVLRHHPDQRWVRDRLARILEAALMAGGAEFTEMAPLVATALLQRARSGGAAPVIDAFASAAGEALAQLQQRRGANDSWSLHRRRLALLMEVETLIRGDAAATEALWGAIRTHEQSGVLDGFAGFRAPAELRLADALRLCGLGPSVVGQRLSMALRAAHHIQDYRFCARITARCNALIRWHGAELSTATLEATIDRLARAPADVEFAAEHVIGEAYAHRHEARTATGDGLSASGASPVPTLDDGQMLPVWEATEANSLDRLADVFQRPVLEFLRSNPEFGLRATIPRGLTVRVPDPGLAPLLAIHLAARAAGETALGFRRARLIRSLLPVASRSATAFDTVLGYLLMASDPEDETLLSAVVAELGAPVLPSAHEPTVPPPTGAMPS
jgi:hypothetical protein